MPTRVAILPTEQGRKLLGPPPAGVTVVVWAGSGDSRELIGLSADAALEVVHVLETTVVGGDGGLVLGEAIADGRVVRVLDLEALGRDR